MKTAKLCLIGFMTLTVFACPQPSFAQIVDFYSSPGYSAMINTMINNHIWNTSMERHYGIKTKGYGGSKSGTSSRSSAPASPPVVPEYRLYPAVQFKSTGTRLTLQDYLDNLQGTPQEKAEIKTMVLDIFNKYEAAAAAKGYPNDWALAFVSAVGLNSHVYSGKTEKPILPFEQNIGLRDLVAEKATDTGMFNNVSDRQKQELYELLVMGGGMAYTLYEKALKENNTAELKVIRQAAGQNLKLLGINP